MKRAAFILLFALVSAVQALEPIRVISLPTLLSALEGMAVLDFAGRPLGRVAELSVDLANGRVRHALVQTASGTHPIPFHLFTPALDGKRLLLDATAERLAQAPEWLGGAEAYWALPRAPRLACSRALLGRAVHGPDGEPAGTLADVVLDAHEGDVAFAVLALAPDRLQPVPLRAFALGEQLVLQLDPQRLARAQHLNAQELDARLADAAALEEIAAYVDQLR